LVDARATPKSRTFTLPPRDDDFAPVEVAVDEAQRAVRRQVGAAVGVGEPAKDLGADGKALRP